MHMAMWVVLNVDAGHQRRRHASASAGKHKGRLVGPGELAAWQQCIAPKPMQDRESTVSISLDDPLLALSVPQCTSHTLCRAHRLCSALVHSRETLVLPFMRCSMPSLFPPI